MSAPDPIAVVIGYRHAPARDPAALAGCVTAWLACPGVGRCYVVDGSDAPVALAPHRRLRRIRVPFDGPFNLSFLRNVGARRAIDDGFRFAQMMDADIFPSARSFVGHCLEAIAGCHLLMPRVVDAPLPAPPMPTGLDPWRDEAFRRFLRSPDGAGRDVWSYSTVFLDLDVPRRLHGWDERYQVWGAEDDDFLLRARAAGFVDRPLEGPPLVHAWHPPHGERRAKQLTAHYAHNLHRLRTTRLGLLPIVRMPADWGRWGHPRPRASALPARFVLA